MTSVTALKALEGAWKFSHRVTAGVEKLDATARVDQGCIEIDVPRFGRHGLVIRATWETEDTLSGRFEAGPTSGTVSLKLLADKRRMVGFPNRFANRERWRLSRCPEDKC